LPSADAIAAAREAPGGKGSVVRWRTIPCHVFMRRQGFLLTWVMVSMSMKTIKCW